MCIGWPPPAGKCGSSAALDLPDCSPYFALHRRTLVDEGTKSTHAKCEVQGRACIVAKHRACTVCGRQATVDRTRSPPASNVCHPCRAAARQLAASADSPPRRSAPDCYTENRSTRCCRRRPGGPDLPRAPLRIEIPRVLGRSWHRPRRHPRPAGQTTHHLPAASRSGATPRPAPR